MLQTCKISESLYLLSDSDDLWLVSKLRLVHATFGVLWAPLEANTGQDKGLRVCGSSICIVLHAVDPLLRDEGELKSHILMLLSEVVLEHLQSIFEILNILLIFEGFLFILIDFLRKIVPGVLVASHLLLQGHDRWLRLDHLLLRVPHSFVPFNLLFNPSNFLLNRLAVLFQKIHTMMDKSILSLIQTIDVRLDVPMIKHCSSLLHFILQTIQLIQLHQVRLPIVSNASLSLSCYLQPIFTLIIKMKNRIKNFDIQTKLGSGSYGVIYKALNKLTREVCVLKQISLGRLSEKARKSAINEATIMGKLVHPFIVRYKQSFIEENTLNIVMEYCDNGDLNHFLKLQNKRPLKQEKIWRFFLEICIGLEYIHKNRILHRDIKTLNIFMNKSQEIKIGDLGVAKMLTSNQFAQTMVGTPFYLSPELCEEKPYNEKSDIWALGCLLYELCTFRHPFEAQNQGSLILKIVRGKYAPIPEFYSKDLKELIDLCLERDYKRRPTTSNILSRPKIQRLVQELGISKLIEEQMAKISKEKENIVSTPKVIQQDKQAIVGKEKLKKTDQQPKKVIKAMDNQPKPELKKEQPKPEPKKQQGKKVYILKKEDPSRKEEEIKKQVKKEPIVILPKPMSERRLDIAEVKQSHEPAKVKQNKNDFINNLQKLMEEDQKRLKRPSKSNYYPEAPIKAADVKKEDKIQRIAEKVEELKKDNHKHINIPKSPSLVEPKRATPAVPDKKNTNSNDPIQSKYKSPVLANKPPMPPSAHIPKNISKDHITKVKNQKVVQPKVYDSQKNIARPQGIIKSGGFSTHVEQDNPSQEKVEPNSREKVMSAKRSSNPNIKVEKEKQQYKKQLFGINPSPSCQRKSEKNIKSSISVLQERKEVKEEKKEEIGKVSRVRKGVKNELSRNARNVSRYNEISKQEEDMVMNLPNNLKNKGAESSDSDEQMESRRDSHVIEELKRKSNHNKFQLKQINHDLVLQKYEDLLKSQEIEQKAEEETEQRQRDDESSEEDINKEFERQIQAEVGSDEVLQHQDNIIEDLAAGQRNSSNSNEPIEELLENGEDPNEEEDLQGQFENEEYDQQEGKRQEWSFDQEPELPMLEQKEEPYFQPDNPYLVEPQQETTENKINYLQLKLQENMKREDEINKLMQIKIEECRKFIGNQKSLQEILEFFRNKLHMEDDYSENDEKEVEVFLRKKGLTDHYKFQNIYKIMHFQMQLENTRKIIQRICKKLSDLQESS